MIVVAFCMVDSAASVMGPFRTLAETIRQSSGASIAEQASQI
jgi:hypothetical protein